MHTGDLRMTDYLGDTPLDDWRVAPVLNDVWTDPNWPCGGVDPPEPCWTVEEDPREQQEFLTGLGVQAAQDVRDSHAPAAVEYLHGDLTRGTMLRTNEAGQVVAFAGGTTTTTFAYTAFGEPVVCAAARGGSRTAEGARSECGAWAVGGDLPDGYPRHGYAGGWGYETGRATLTQRPTPNAFPPSDLLSLEGANPALPPITLQHVGARWYEPGFGRFVQRDPIGIMGGMNVYAYCANEPVTRIDPRGLWTDDSVYIPDHWTHGGIDRAPHPTGPVDPTDFVDNGGGLAGPGDGLGRPPLLPAPAGHIIGPWVLRRVPKQIVLPGQSLTKNAISAWLVRHGPPGWGNAFRYLAPWLGPACVVSDYLFMLETLLWVNESTGGDFGPYKYLPPHMSGFGWF